MDNTAEVSVQEKTKVSHQILSGLTIGVGIALIAGYGYFAALGVTTKSTTATQTVTPDITYRWSRAIGGVDYDQASGVTTDSSGNIYVAGIFRGTVDFDPTAGTDNHTASGAASDVFVRKLTAGGAYGWTVTLSHSAEDIAGGIATDISGNILVTGTTGGGAFLAKIQPDGQFVWTKNLAGGTGSSVASDASGNVHYAGYFRGTTDFDPGAGQDLQHSAHLGLNAIFVSKFSEDGTYLWTKTFGQSDTAENTDLAVDAQGNILVAGSGSTLFFIGDTFITASGQKDSLVIKLDPDGAYVWGKMFGGLDWDETKRLAVDASGNVLLTGGFSGTVNFNPTGIVSDVRTSMNATIDIFLTKLLNDGSYAWTQTWGGNNSDVGLGVTTDRNGNIYTVSDFSATTSLAKFSSAGVPIWSANAVNLIVTSTNRPLDLVYNQTTNALIIAGFLSGSVDIDLTGGQSVLTSKGKLDAFVSVHALPSPPPSSGGKLPTQVIEQPQ